MASGFGASLVTLFMRVSGGIPEDDPRNPGVIADNVDDVAGVAAVTAAIFLAAILGFPAQYDVILFATLAPVATFVGVNLLKTSGVKHLPSAISMAIYATIAPSVALFFIGSLLLGLEAWKTSALAAATSLGASMAPVILKITDYYTSYNYGPARRIAEQTKISPATVIITSYGVGLWELCT